MNAYYLIPNSRWLHLYTSTLKRSLKGESVTSEESNWIGVISFHFLLLHRFLTVNDGSYRGSRKKSTWLSLTINQIMYIPPATLIISTNRSLTLNLINSSTFNENPGNISFNCCLLDLFQNHYGLYNKYRRASLHRLLCINSLWERHSVAAF